MYREKKRDKWILPKDKPDKTALYSGQLETGFLKCENFMYKMQFKRLP